MRTTRGSMPAIPRRGLAARNRQPTCAPRWRAACCGPRRSLAARRRPACMLATHAAAMQGFRKIASEQGFKGLFKGWVPTAIGYSAQGAFKVRGGASSAGARPLAASPLGPCAAVALPLCLHCRRTAAAPACPRRACCCQCVAGGHGTCPIILMCLMCGCFVAFFPAVRPVRVLQEVSGTGEEPG